jgi:hypothetical protein
MPNPTWRDSINLSEFGYVFGLIALDSSPKVLGVPANTALSNARLLKSQERQGDDKGVTALPFN